MGTGIDIWQFFKQQFPEQGDRIAELYQSSEDFRSLCADYILCMDHLQKFTREAGEKTLSIQEYLTISKDLEYELSQFLMRAHSSH